MTLSPPQIPTVHKWTQVTQNADVKQKPAIELNTRTAAEYR